VSDDLIERGVLSGGDVARCPLTTDLPDAGMWIVFSGIRRQRMITGLSTSLRRLFAPAKGKVKSWLSHLSFLIRI
jgi:hypothetical protein